MERLLSENEFHMLKTRAGISQSSLDRLRRERREIFRKYLRCLAADFSSITDEIRSIMIGSQVSRADLAKTLVKARCIFTVAMIAIEFRLALHAFGIYSLKISAAALTSNLEHMRLRLDVLSLEPVLQP